LIGKFPYHSRQFLSSRLRRAGSDEQIVELFSRLLTLDEAAAALFEEELLR